MLQTAAAVHGLCPKRKVEVSIRKSRIALSIQVTAEERSKLALKSNTAVAVISALREHNIACDDKWFVRFNLEVTRYARAHGARTKTTRLGRTVGRLRKAVALGLDDLPSGITVNLTEVSSSGDRLATPFFTTRDAKCPRFQKVETEIDKIKQSCQRDAKILGESSVAELKAEKLDDSFDRYQRALKLWTRGIASSVIKKNLGLSLSSLRSWVYDQRLPVSISHPKGVEAKDRNWKRQLRRENLPLAYLLGVVCARQKQGFATSSLTFQDDSKDVVRLYALRLAQLFPSRKVSSATKVEDTDSFEISFTHTRLQIHIDEVSNKKARVPWEHLVSEQEKILFLQGIADGMSSVESLNASPTLNFTKRGSTQLIHEVACLLNELGIQGNVPFDDQGVMFINQQYNLERFQQKIGYRDLRRGRLLKQAVEKPKGKKTYSPEQYDSVMSMGRKKQTSFASIAAKANVGEGTVSNWLAVDRPRTRPDSVEKRQRLIELRERYPNAEQIGYLYRTLGFSSSASREIEATVPKEELKQRIAHLKSLPTLNNVDVEQFLRTGQQRSGLRRSEKAELLVKIMPQPVTMRINSLAGAWDSLERPHHSAERVLQDIHEKHPAVAFHLLRQQLVLTLSAHYRRKYRGFVEAYCEPHKSFWS